jgi:hypothetical protein
MSQKSLLADVKLITLIVSSESPQMGMTRSWVSFDLTLSAI